ncbi:MAG: hypothetical protein IT542_06010 [Rubellimicrobium sp.]|nr:hypothetical protein [Rubellimicrobium sp.]
MAEWKLTRARLIAGVWEGVLSGGTGTPPPLEARHLDRVLPGLSVTAAEGAHVVRLSLPADVIADGVQTVVILDRDSGRPLDSVALIAGDALAHDIRAEVDLLRAELDMLKRAFRRHCNETA